MFLYTLRVDGNYTPWSVNCSLSIMVWESLGGHYMGSSRCNASLSRAPWYWGPEKRGTVFTTLIHVYWGIYLYLRFTKDVRSTNITGFHIMLYGKHLNKRFSCVCPRGDSNQAAIASHQTAGMLYFLNYHFYISFSFTIRWDEWKGENLRTFAGSKMSSIPCRWRNM